MNEVLTPHCPRCMRNSCEHGLAVELATDAAANRTLEMASAIDPFCLDMLGAVLAQGDRPLTGAEAHWLLDEAYRLLRAERALDARVAELEGQLKSKDADYTGVCLEYADLSDENARLRQELEIDRIVLEARGRTLLQLQQRLESGDSANE